MAKTYTSTIQLKVRKEHTCVGCGGAYSYVFQRAITGSAPTPDRASANAKKNVQKALTYDVDLHPCPSCGLYQPAMVGRSKVVKHQTVLWLTLVGLVGTVILKLTHVLNTDVAAWTLAVVCGVAAVFYTFIDRKNLNADLDANRRAAQDRVAKSVIVQRVPGRGGTVAEEIVNPPRSVTHRLAVPLLFASIVMAAAPELLRMSKHWPLNPQYYPPVVGPGDDTRFYMADSISSIKGYWRGRPEAALAVAGSKEKIPLQTTTNQNDWGHSISVKSSEKSTSSHPWLELTLPDNASLEGKQAHCDMRLDVAFPQVEGTSSFVTHRDSFSQSTDLQLAAAHAGRQYTSLWWEGGGAAIGLVLVSGVILSSTARKLLRGGPPATLYDA